MMKRIIATSVIALAAITAMAADIKTLVITPQPRMSCQNCEKRIKGNMRFEKGVKMIATDLKKQTITIKYDAEKTTEQNLLKALKKLNYTPAPAEKKK